MFNYDASANTDDGSCIPFTYGCMDDTENNDGTYATNYNSLANVDDGSCNAYNCLAFSGINSVGPNLWANGNPQTANTTPKISINTWNTPYANTTSTMGGGSPNGFTVEIATVMTGIFAFPNWQFLPSNDLHWNNMVVNGEQQGIKTVNGGIMGNAAGFFDPGDIQVEMAIKINTNDGNCVDEVYISDPLLIGCNDASLDPAYNNNLGNFDLTDNTQCVITGCMDDSYMPQAGEDPVNGPFTNSLNATNYNPLATIQPTGACTYGNPTIDYVITEGATRIQLVASTENSPYNIVDDSSTLQVNNIVTFPGQVVANVNNETVVLRDFQQTFTLTINGWVALDTFSSLFSSAIHANFSGTYEYTAATLAGSDPPLYQTQMNFPYMQFGCKDSYNTYDYIINQQRANNPDITYSNENSGYDLHEVGSCLEIIHGCMDPAATNYNSNATHDLIITNADQIATGNDGCFYSCLPPTNGIALKQQVDIGAGNPYNQMYFELYSDGPNNYTSVANEPATIGYELTQKDVSGNVVQLENHYINAAPAGAAASLVLPEHLWPMEFEGSYNAGSFYSLEHVPLIPFVSGDKPQFSARCICWAENPNDANNPSIVYSSASPNLGIIIP